LNWPDRMRDGNVDRDEGCTARGSGGTFRFYRALAGRFPLGSSVIVVCTPSWGAMQQRVYAPRASDGATRARARLVEESERWLQGSGALVGRDFLFGV